MPLTNPRIGMCIAQRFEIESVAGTGGMGTVYRARDGKTGEVVALKLLHPQSSYPEERARFAREAKVLASLSHPGIVSYVAHGSTEEDQLFLAMEWLDGEDLGNRLLRSQLTVAESLSVIQQAAAALSVAHQAGVIHRDIKPRNVLTDRNAPDTLP